MRRPFLVLVILALAVPALAAKPVIHPAKPPASPEDSEPAQAKIRLVLA